MAPASAPRLALEPRRPRWRAVAGLTSGHDAQGRRRPRQAVMLTSARSSTTTSAPACGQLRRLAEPVDADHEAEAAAPAGLDAGEARPRPPRSAPRPLPAGAPSRGTSAGSGLPGSPTSAATTPSTRTSNRSVVPVTSSTMAVFLLDDMRPTLIPASRSSWMSVTVDGEGPDAVLPHLGVEEVVLAVAEPADGLRARAGRTGRPWAARCRARRGSRGRRRSAACRPRRGGSRPRGRTAAGGRRARRPGSVPVRAARSSRYASKSRFQAAACTAAVWVTTPSRSKMTASYSPLLMVARVRSMLPPVSAAAPMIDATFPPALTEPISAVPPSRRSIGSGVSRVVPRHRPQTELAARR